MTASERIREARIAAERTDDTDPIVLWGYINDEPILAPASAMNDYRIFQEV